MSQRSLNDCIKFPHDTSVELLHEDLSQFPLSQVYHAYGEELERRNAKLPYSLTPWTFKEIAGIRKLSRTQDPEEARQQARQQFMSFMEGFNKRGGHISIEGSKNIEGASLMLANHQFFGLEALGIYNFLPDDGRVVLKDELVQIPFIGNGLRALDPIVFNRKDKRNAIKHVMAEVGETIKEGHPVLIFPQGTRTNGDIEISPLLIKDPIKFLQEIEQRKIAIITAHVQACAPNKPEKSLFSRFRDTPIRFRVDSYEIPEFDPKDPKALTQVTRDTARVVTEIMTGNLYRFLAEDMRRV